MKPSVVDMVFLVYKWFSPWLLREGGREGGREREREREKEREWMQQLNSWWKEKKEEEKEKSLFVN